MKVPIIRLLWLLTAAAASAATHAVLPGEAIQPKIDIAAPGDIIAIFGGTYPGDVTINKAVRLVEVDGQEVTITGNVTWNNVTNAPPFEGFTVGSAGKRINVSSGTNITFKSINGVPGDAMSIQGSTTVVSIVGSQISGINQDGGSLVVGRTTVVGAVNASPNSVSTLAYQCTIGGDCSWNAPRSWISYSSAKKFDFNGNGGRIVLLGSNFDFGNRSSDAVYLAGTSNAFLVANCVIGNIRHGHHRYYDPGATTYVEQSYPGRGIFVNGSGNSAKILNNYIWMNWNPAIYNGSYDNGGGEGIRVYVTDALIANNIVKDARYGIYAPFGASALNNFYQSPKVGWERGGVVALGTLVGDPLFTAAPPELQASSPCINAGVNDPIFNDLDGTRNDIGPGGGCLFDPDGWTTNKPVVISFDLAPQQLLKGVDTEVTISNGQAVAQP